MHITDLSTYNYRNLEDQNISLHSGVNFLIGKNGQGKTNFIEAISLLSRGRSFKTSKSRELVKSGTKETSVFANVKNAELEFNIGIAIKQGEKEYYFNQDKLPSLKDFIGRLIAISFSPDDLNLIKGGPLERRNFLDKHILDIKPSYIDHVFSYQRALKNKSNILKNNFSAGKNDLMPWNQILSESGSHIMKERLLLLEKILPRVAHYYRIFSNEDSEVKISIKNGSFSYDNYTAENLMQAFQNNIERELTQKNCIIGIHKDDIEVTLNGKNARFYASQGETRSLVLAMKISVLDEIENTREMLPLLLLDDVDSELDSSRRQALADIIFSKERQIIITGTQLPHFEQQKSSNFFIFDVSHGVVSRSVSVHG
jgi:DNA replication and repair protein RecF